MADPDPGTTLGVEEEFHLVDPDRRVLVPAALDVVAAASKLGVEVDPEFQRTSIETATAVCRSLGEVRQQLVARRRDAAAAAGEVGAALMACGTVPMPGAAAHPVYPDDRYYWMAGEFGRVAAEHQICSCQVQVGIADREVAVGVLNRVRRWLPVLLALTASSPYWDGRDTSFASYRTMLWTRWPTAGPTGAFASAEEYARVVQALQGTGTARDAGMMYFDVRLSHRYPTVEIRVSDACPRIDDAVLLAGLGRALVTTAARETLVHGPVDDTRVELLRSATWRAARSGLGGELVDPVTWSARPAAEVVGTLLDHLSGALHDSGDDREVSDLLAAVLAGGTSAQRQRAVFARGSAADVVDHLLAETAG